MLRRGLKPRHLEYSGLMKLKRTRPSNALTQTFLSIRRRIEMDQVEFGRVLKVWRNTVSRYELGQLKPGPRVLFEMLALTEIREERDVLKQALSAQGINLKAEMLPEIVPTQGGQGPASGAAGALGIEATLYQPGGGNEN